MLWDIDHTLIENAGVSKEIYAAAFTSLAGRPPVRPARTEGRTDRLIISDMFHDHGLEPPAWEDALPALEAAGSGREADLRQRGRVLPGVYRALKSVAAEEDMVSSVLTGNIAANARVKLGAFGLDALLDLENGAYGADSTDRAGLVDHARSRIRAAYGLADDLAVVLIGDTPRDVDAALQTSSHIVAVASGVNSAGELQQAGAHFVLPDLSDTHALMEHLRRLAHH